jgi:AcrR family transcriptional regulator
LLDKPRSQARRKASPRRKRGRPEDQGGKRVGADAIVLNTCELLRNIAPNDVTLSRVARYAGVDRSLIRYYFKNRSSLLLAAARQLVGQLRIELELAWDVPSEDPETRIRENIRALLRFQIEHPYFHRLMLDEVINSDEPEAREFFASITSAAVENLRAAATAAARSGATRPVDGAFLYMAIIGMCEFFVTGAPILKVAFGENYDIEDVCSQYENFICDYVVDGLRKR